jgi:NAD(P)-dependent dehydrogenase (short-subunit alcohol dehydrogenase family)
MSWSSMSALSCLGCLIRLDETVELVRATGRQAVAAVADVRDPSAMAQAVASAEEAFGHLEIVVANAGINLSAQPTHELDDEAWRLVIDINLTGVFNTARAAVPALLRSPMTGKSINHDQLGGGNPSTDGDRAVQRLQVRGGGVDEDDGR